MTLIKRKNALETRGGLLRTNLFPTSSFFDDFLDVDFPRFNFLNELESKWIPNANIKQKENEFIVEMEVPGLTKEDIHVEIDDNNMLRISSDREEESEEETDNYARKEYSHRSFVRSFQLPENIKEEKISAKCKNGILTLELPRKTEVKIKKTKEIEVA